MTLKKLSTISKIIEEIRFDNAYLLQGIEILERELGILKQAVEIKEKYHYEGTIPYEEAKRIQESREKYQLDQASFMAEAIKEGELIAQREIAKNLLIGGYTIEKVKKFTDLTEEEILELKK